MALAHRPGEHRPVALHEDELTVDADLVRRLVARSFPRYADLPLVPLGDSGSSNILFRLGAELLVRLPRQPGGGAALAKEARWTPFVASGLSVAVPEVLAIGPPGEGYGERWLLTRWLDGTTPARPASYLAAQLGRLLAELRELPVPEEARADPDLAWYRCGPLAACDDSFRAAVAACRELPWLDLDLDRALALWDELLDAGRGPVPTGWLHGDLLAENLLVSDGQLVALLDLGGLGVGDPAVDLMAAWELLDPAGRSALRRELGVDDATWARGRGWALLVAMVTFPYYGTTMPQRCASRLAMARAAIAQGVSSPERPSRS